MRNPITALLVLFLLITGTVFHIGGCHNSNGNGGGMPEDVQNEFTPIVSSFVTIPRPVLGSDGRYHMTYELQLTNANTLTWLINSVEVLNADDHDQVFVKFSGDTVAPNNQITPGRIPSNTLARSETSLFYITFSVESLDDVPEKIAHRFNITVPGGIPDGFLSFLSLPPGTPALVQVIAETQVPSIVAVNTGPPLRGTKWIAADGCCTSEHHVRAVLPINGKLVISQRFAVDWEKMNDENRIFVGDPQDVHSYFAYGEDVLAVGEGRVVVAVDKYEDQIPGAFPVGIPLEEADGNHVVIDLGNGNFAFYAHLIKDSVAVKVGDFVTRGQVIGLLGNTGNSLVPHLHFHMMSGPSTFGSDGIPYMIYEYELIEQAESIEAFNEAEATGNPLLTIPVDNPGIHKDDLPLDLSIVNFAQ